MTVDKKVIKDDTISFIKRLINDCEQYSNTCYKRADKIKESDYTFAAINMVEGNIHAHLGIAYELIERIVKTINSLGIAIDKLPKRQEFDDVRNEVDKQRKKVQSTLEPIKKAYEEQFEREKRGDAVYG
jgi:hypothetical protein